MDSNGILTVIAGTGSPGLTTDGSPALSAKFNNLHGVAVDSSGNVFIADTNNGRIREVTPAGVISTAVGTGAWGSAGDAGAAVSAELAGPRGLAIDQAGNLFIADSGNNKVRMVTPSGIITTVAGNGTQGFSGDGGPATSSQLNYPVAVAVDGSGNLFIADRQNNRIRMVNSAGIISTIAGSTSGFSGDGGPAVSAQISDPRGIAIDSTGNLFIADSGNNRIRMINPAGIITTFAGGAAGFSGDGGAATSAQLALPVDVAADAAGNIFIADRGNYRVRTVNAARVITTAAGRTDDGGPASSAQLNYPNVVAADRAGNLYIADTDSQRVRKVTTTGMISTIAGNGAQGFSGDGGPAASAQLNYPAGVTVDANGTVFIADTRNGRIRKVTPGGTITTIAGNGKSGFGGDGGPATSALLSEPSAVAVDVTGNLLISDTGNQRVRKVDPNGVISTFAGNGTKSFGGDGGPAASAQLNNPAGIAVDGAGNVFIADSGNNRIRIVTPDGTINTVAGDGTYAYGGDGGPAVSAHLAYPNGVAADAAGNLFIADTDNQRIRKLTSDGLISTVAGNGTYGMAGDGGTSTTAQLASPYSVAINATNALVIADTSSSRIRQIVSPVTPFAVADRGGVVLRSDGNSASTRVGYGIVQPDSPGAPTSGLAIYSYHSGNYLASETSVPAISTLQSGRIYAEINGPTDTGIAIANPNNQPATVQFFFTDGSGNNVGEGKTTVGPNQQIARFLDNYPFGTYSGPSFQGTFSFTSDVPVAVVAIRGVVNERQDFLMSTLPVIDTTIPPAAAPVIVPHFSDGAGWTTEILLMNPTDATMTGIAEFRDGNGLPVNVTVAGQTSSDFVYAVSPRSSQKFATAGTGSSTTGSVRILPGDGALAPIPLVIFSYKPAGITLSQAGVSSSSATAFRMYVESSGSIGQSRSIQSGVAVTNNSSNPITVALELTNLDGSATGFPPAVTQNLPGYGHFSLFLAQLFQGLPNTFKGILRVSTQSAGISVVGLRSHYNERGDFLITTTPPSVENAAQSSTELVLPHLPDGGGYTTEFVLFSTAPGQATSGSLLLFQQSGQPFPVTLR